MANDFVKVAPDSTGKAVQTFLNTVGGTPVEAQGIALVDSGSGSAIASSTAALTGTEMGLAVRLIPSTTLAQLVQQGAPNAVAANGWPTKLTDATGNIANVFQFHNADNQALGASSFGLNTGGVAQLLNAGGRVDRQRETGTDNAPAAGIASGSQQLASPISITLAQVVTGNVASQTVNVSAISGTNRGAAWNIQPGTVLLVEPGLAAAEAVVVTAVATGPARVTGIFLNSHLNNGAVTTAAYNQARDATAPDGSTGQGFAAGATFLFNGTLNTGAGGWESERSAAGEQDGATGVGTAVATEYLFNSGGPLLTGAVTPSQLGYDRARNLQGKGRGTSTLAQAGTLAVGSTSLNLAAVVGLMPGSPIIIEQGLANEEVVYVATTATLPLTATAVPLASPTVATHANGVAAAWDIYVNKGPGLNGFLATGIAIAEEALWDPVSSLFYLERSATQDAMPGVNIVAEAPALWNGATFDRARSGSAATLAATSALGSELTVLPGNWTVVSTPAANTQASAIKAAGAAGVRHICNSISASFAAGATAGAAVLVNLLDGATIVWSQYLTAPVGDVRAINLTGLNIPGTAATSMTLQFAAAGGLTTLESVTIGGYDTI